MTSNNTSEKRKRVRRFRDVNQTKDFDRDWEHLEASGKHDMYRIQPASKVEMLVFSRITTHSELFK